MNELTLINTYLAVQTEQRPDVLVGIGDDGAIINLEKPIQLVLTTDTLVSGVHFPKETLPFDLGYKALAVNLSDLAAMGAKPAWILLALTLPFADPSWMEAFSEGLFTLANRYNVTLIGGDLSKGPLSITITALGKVPKNEALLRSGAQPFDLIYVTGTLGDAGLALKALETNLSLSSDAKRFVMERLNRPEPRIETGLALHGIASSAIDISDGLANDLGHILAQSKVGAKINVDKLPQSSALKEALSKEEAIALSLTAGDDYELCFTVPPSKKSLLENKLSQLACRYTLIGEITKDPHLILSYQDGRTYHGPILGYDHFRST